MKNSFPDAFEYIFPNFASFFLRNDDEGMVSIVEGDPGVGKTLLALEIVQRLVQDRQTKSKILFLPLEQDVSSLRHLVEDFAPKNFLDDKCVFKKSSTQWPHNLGEKSDGCALFWKPNQEFENAANMVLAIEKELVTVSSKLPGDCELLVVDNANVFVPQNGQNINGDCDPLTRGVLRDIQKRARRRKACVLLVVEGQPKIKAPHIEFFADVVVRLSHMSSEYGTMIGLQVVKSRNRERSPGIHTITIDKDGYNVWPSPESVLKRLQPEINIRKGSDDRAVLKFDKGGLAGWDDELGGIIREGDIVAVVGKNNAGKSRLIRRLLRCSEKRYLFRWQKQVAGNLKNTVEEIGFRGDPFWCANRIFFNLFHCLSMVPVDAALAIDNIQSLRANFPQGGGHTFIPAMFELLRGLGQTSFVEVSEDEICHTVTNLADVVISVDQLATEGGALSTLTVTTRHDRGEIRGQAKTLEFDAQRGRISAEPLNAFIKTPDGKAERVSVHIVAPCDSPAEKTHAKRLWFDTGAIVGFEHAHLIGLTSKPDPADVAFVTAPDRANKMSVPERYVSRYMIAETLMSMATYPRDDLCIVVCEDDVLEADDWIESRDKCLASLGTVEEWLDRLDIKKESDLLEPFITRDGTDQVIAVPYGIDVGLLAYKEDVWRDILGCKNKATFLKSLGWNDIHKGLCDLMQEPMSTELKNKHSLTMPFFSLTGFSRDAWISTVIECLCDLGKMPLDGQFHPSRNKEEFYKLVEMFREQKGMVSWDTNTDAAIWRTWYSRLSMLEASNLLELQRRKNIKTQRATSHQKWICSTRYLVIPNGSVCLDLGKYMISRFARKEYALERMRSFVSLSPYVEQFTSKSVFVPDWITGVCNNPSTYRDVAVKRNMISSHYRTKGHFIEDVFMSAVFSGKESDMDTLLSELNQKMSGKWNA